MSTEDKVYLYLSSMMIEYPNANYSIITNKTDKLYMYLYKGNTLADYKKELGQSILEVAFKVKPIFIPPDNTIVDTDFLGTFELLPDEFFFIRCQLPSDQSSFLLTFAD